MRIHTQFKTFFVAVLIALAALTTVTAPARVMGGGQAKSPAHLRWRPAQFSQQIPNPE
jgi:hypothetical protein